MSDAPPARPIADLERLARFVFSSSGVRNDLTVRPEAFSPPKNLELSVTRHIGLDESAIWNIGQNIADKRPATLHGRADVSALSVRKNKLDVVPSEPPVNHANVINWPTDKPSQKIIALELAAAAKYIPKP